MTRKFRYVGTGDEILVRGIVIRKGETFETANVLLADFLATIQPHIEEVGPEPQEPSRRSHAGPRRP